MRTLSYTEIWPSERTGLETTSHVYKIYKFKIVHFVDGEEVETVWGKKKMEEKFAELQIII